MTSQVSFVRVDSKGLDFRVKRRISESPRDRRLVTSGRSPGSHVRYDFAGDSVIKPSGLERVILCALMLLR
jgi:hypothetical protein